jgi:hypothetical protein
MAIEALVGSKNDNGSIYVVSCRHGGTPENMMPVLLEQYGVVENVCALVNGGCFELIADTPDQITYVKLGNVRKTGLFFTGIKELLQHIEKGNHAAEYVYLWIDGYWTCAQVNGQKELCPLHFEKIPDTDKVSFSTCSVLDLNEWIAANFAEALPTLKVVRLSKEEWLKQHYPGMTELPKWRFPAMAG